MIHLPKDVDEDPVVVRRHDNYSSLLNIGVRAGHHVPPGEGPLHPGGDGDEWTNRGDQQVHRPRADGDVRPAAGEVGTP